MNNATKSEQHKLKLYEMHMKNYHPETIHGIVFATNSENAMDQFVTCTSTQFDRKTRMSLYVPIEVHIPAVYAQGYVYIERRSA